MALSEADVLKARQKAYSDIIAQLTSNSIELNKILQKGNKQELARFYRAQTNAAIASNTLASKMQDSIKMLDKFNASTPAGKMLYLGQAMTNAGKALTEFRDKLYNLQAKLGTTFNTAIDTGAGALVNTITSVFSKGPSLSFQDTIDAVNAYQKEFGTLLTRGAAQDVAKGSKQFGTDINTFVRAQRAFLVGPNSVANQAKIQNSFVKEFRAAGLTANQSLKFAAENANLIAIAGDKYADSLARAAANATKIGVSLNKTEQFADNLVGDFEGALERFSELRAMGVEVDFNELARIAGTGTPEEVFNELSRQLGGNNKLLDELQGNRFLKVALEKDLGLNIDEIRRLAAGKSGLPGEETKPEKVENGALQAFMKVAGPLLSVMGGLATVVGFNTIATQANTMAVLRQANLSMSSLLQGTGGGLLKAGGIGLGIAGLGMSAYGGFQAGKNKSLGGSAMSVLGGAASGAMIGSMIAPGVGTAIGAILGGVISLGSAIAGYTTANDLAMGPGKGRVILGPEGKFKLNPGDSLIAGTNLFGSMGEKGMQGREMYDIATLLRNSIGRRFLLSKNVLSANPYANAAIDTSFSLMQGKGLGKSLAAGGGTLAGGVLGSLGGVALGRVVGGAVGSALGPVGSILGGMAGSAIASYMMKDKPSAGQLTAPQTMTAQQMQGRGTTLDTSNLESKMDKVANAISNMRVTMDANPVGRIVTNSGSPVELATR